MSVQKTKNMNKTQAFKLYEKAVEKRDALEHQKFKDSKSKMIAWIKADGVCFRLQIYYLNKTKWF